MKINITTGNVRVIDSGSVMTYNNLPIDFSVEGLLIRFQFETDSSAKPFVNVTPISSIPNSLLFTFRNYDILTGIGNIKPVNVGDIANKKLYLSYRIYSIQNDADKLIHYTFFVEI